MSRFAFEIEGVIDAEDEAGAEALADLITRNALNAYRFGADAVPQAALATCVVAVVVKKTKAEA